MCLPFNGAADGIIFRALREHAVIDVRICTWICLAERAAVCVPACLYVYCVCTCVSVCICVFV